MSVKTDRIDARNIAWALQSGWYRAVHVNSQATHKIRALLRSRAMLVGSRVDLDNHLRGILKAFGLKVGKARADQFETRVKELVENDGMLNCIVGAILGVRADLMRRLDLLGRLVMLAVRSDRYPSADDHPWCGTFDGSGVPNGGGRSSAVCQSIVGRIVLWPHATQVCLR